MVDTVLTTILITSAFWAIWVGFVRNAWRKEAERARRDRIGAVNRGYATLHEDMEGEQYLVWRDK